MLGHEGAAASADECATAAGLVYDKLHAQLDPLFGVAGVQALLVRSAKLARAQFAFLEPALLDSVKLRECLRTQSPTVALESAAALFGTLFALMTTLIGERLMTQVLRSAWPTIEETAVRETSR